MPRRVSGSVQDLDTSAADFDNIMIGQHPCRSSLKYCVAAHVVAVGKLAAVGDHSLYRFRGQREFPVQPVQFLGVGAELGEIFVTADMIPMDMSGDRRNGLIGELDHLVVYIAYAQSRVDKQTFVRAVQQIAVCFLPMAVLAYNMRFVVDTVYCKPVIQFPFSPVKSFVFRKSGNFNSKSSPKTFNILSALEIRFLISSEVPLLYVRCSKAYSAV